MIYIYSKCGRKKPAAKNMLLSKAIIQTRRRDKEFPKQTKVKGIHDHKTSPTRDDEWKGKSISRSRKSRKHKSSKINYIYENQSRDSQNKRM